MNKNDDNDSFFLIDLIGYAVGAIMLYFLFYYVIGPIIYIFIKCFA